MIFPETAAVKALYDDGKIVGVQTGDKGLDKDGQPKANFEPGIVLKSPLTIFCDGTNSPLFKRVAKELDLNLIEWINHEGANNNVNPFDYGSNKYTKIMKTEALLQGLNHHGFDCAFGGARRDEERSRAKERIYFRR